MFFVFWVIIFIFVFLLGLGVGSFLLVLVDRTERGEGALTGRSYCENCEKTLSASELLPLVSFLMQKGECRSCQEPLSYQYPAVEFLTGVAFLLVFARTFQIFQNFQIFQGGAFHGELGGLAGLGGVVFTTQIPLLFFIALFAGFVIASLLVLIFLYDLRHKIIPNEFSYTFALVALLVFLAKAFLSDGLLFWTSSSFLWGILSGPILAFPFAFLWFISRGTWMGLGDAKLSLGIGWLFGMTAGFTVVVIAFWAGAVTALFLMATNWVCGKMHWSGKGNTLTMKSELPLGPFLILAVAMVFALGLNFFDGGTAFSFIH